jgi:hypothetical protein
MLDAYGKKTFILISNNVLKTSYERPLLYIINIIILKISSKNFQASIEILKSRVFAQIFPEFFLLALRKRLRKRFPKESPFAQTFPQRGTVCANVCANGASLGKSSLGKAVFAEEFFKEKQLMSMYTNL